VAIFSARYTTDLPSHVTPAVEAAGLPASSLPDLYTAITNGTTAALSSVPGVSSSILATMSSAVQDANSSSFKIVYLSCLGFGGVSIVAAMFATDVSKYMTSFVNKTIASSAPVNQKEGKFEMDKV
jgi:uncharacterized membrane protein